MRPYLGLLALLTIMVQGCGTYTSESVDLNDTQLDAIRSKLAAACLSDNAQFFVDLKSRFTTTIGTSINRVYYEVAYSNTSDTNELGIYTIYDNTVYFITSGDNINTPSGTDRVYKFTLDTQNTFFSDTDYLTDTICTSPNTFTASLNDFTYTINDAAPDSSDEDRTEYSTLYRNYTSLPLVFSAYNYEYTTTVYENDDVSKTTKRTAAMTSKTLPSGSDLFEETRFDNADHCSFDSITTWVALSAKGVDLSAIASCASKGSSSGRFDWDDVDPSIH